MRCIMKPKYTLLWTHNKDSLEELKPGLLSKRYHIFVNISIGFALFCLYVFFHIEFYLASAFFLFAALLIFFFKIMTPIIATKIAVKAWEKQKKDQILFLSFFDQHFGIEVASEKLLHVKYSKIRRIVETNHYFTIFIIGHLYFILSKDSFDSDAQEKEWLQFLIKQNRRIRLDRKIKQ